MSALGGLPCVMECLSDAVRVLGCPNHVWSIQRQEARDAAGAVPAHAVVVTFDPGAYFPDYRLVCHRPDADCHYACAEGCDEWGPIVRNEHGAVMGHEASDGTRDVLHEMQYRPRCGLVEWFENDDSPLESMRGTPHVVTIPVDARFDGADEGITWTALT